MLTLTQLHGARIDYEVFLAMQLMSDHAWWSLTASLEENRSRAMVRADLHRLAATLLDASSYVTMYEWANEYGDESLYRRMQEYGRLQVQIRPIAIQQTEPVN